MEALVDIWTNTQRKEVMNKAAAKFSPPLTRHMPFGPGWGQGTPECLLNEHILVLGPWFQGLWNGSKTASSRDRPNLPRGRICARILGGDVGLTQVPSVREGLVLTVPLTEQGAYLEFLRNIKYAGLGEIVWTLHSESLTRIYQPSSASSSCSKHL